MSRVIGVVSLQGSFTEHLRMLERLGGDIRAVQVRNRSDLQLCDALILPGGESSCHRRLLSRTGLDREIAGRVGGGMPIWGTCSGLILLAGTVTDARGEAETPYIPAIPITAERNSYGRQIDSFTAELEIPLLPGGLFEGVFIRAPRIIARDEEVEVLARHRGEPVACRYANVVVTSFHPELTGDVRMHRWFCSRAICAGAGEQQVAEA